MRQMLASLMNSRNSLKNIQIEVSRATILGVLIQVSEGDTIKIIEIIYGLTRELYRSFKLPKIHRHHDEK